MRIRSKITTLSLSICLSITLPAQRIDSALQMLANRFPTEKVFIHYDKETYLAGETIWFKAYLLNNGLPGSLNTNFYLKFINSNGIVVSEKKYPVIGATVKGNIDLSDSLPQGNYYVQASTASMMNYGPELTYQRNIFVFNPSVKSVDKPRTSQQIDVRFFPESGTLIEGVSTVVAFKAVDAGGNPVEIDGVIRTEEGTAISSFRSYHDGMGKTQFKPVAGKKYHAEIEYNGSQVVVPLQEVQPSGINLKVQDEKGGKMFLLARGEKNKDQFSKLTIVAVLNQHVVYETAIDFEDYPSVKGHLVTDSLPSGILHFTVFNNDGLPIAERFSFIDNKEYRSASTITGTEISFAKKASNALEISFPENIQRSVSVAVVDGTNSTSVNKESIWSAFLLTGDLKGNIYNPAYYFDNSNDSVSQAMDNVMLIHGWVRYEWKKILANQFPATKIADKNLLSVSGVVNDAQNKSAVSEGKLNIYAESADSSTQNFEVPIDKQGRFHMDSIVFYGKTKFFYAYTNGQGKERPATIQLDNQEISNKDQDLPLLQPMQLSVIAPVVPGNTLQQYNWLKAAKEEVKVLEKVILESKSSKKPIEIVNEKYTTGVFRAMGKVNIDNVNQPPNDKAMNGIDFIKNRIQQVEFSGGRFVSRKNFSLSTGQKWPVGVFIDESPADPTQLRVLRADEIALVKYYEAGFVGVGSGTPGGAIAVYTTKTENLSKPSKLEFFTQNGYAVTRQFYQPDYSRQELAQVIDNRTTLYWNPELYTDSEGSSIKIHFFNNDRSKKFRVVVEGFDAKGRLIHAEKILTP